MGVSKSALVENLCVYIDYPFEEVMFRWDGPTKSIFRRFYGEDEANEPVAHDNHLFFEALNDGNQITVETYTSGKPRR